MKIKKKEKINIDTDIENLFSFTRDTLSFYDKLTSSELFK